MIGDTSIYKFNIVKLVVSISLLKIKRKSSTPTTYYNNFTIN